VKPTENGLKAQTGPEGAGPWVNPVGVGPIQAGILFPQVETCGYSREAPSGPRTSRFRRPGPNPIQEGYAVDGRPRTTDNGRLTTDH
jgi:hypothetical protein